MRLPWRYPPQFFLCKEISSCFFDGYTTTPSYAGESKKNYIVKKPSGRMEVAVGQLQQQSPGGFFDERKRYWEFAAYDMEVSIPYRICAPIQTVSHIWTDQEGYRTNSAEIMMGYLKGKAV